MASNATKGVADRLRILRKVRGYTAKELCEVAGMPGSVVSGIEQGVIRPTPEKLAKLAEALQVDLDELLGETAGRTKSQAVWMAMVHASLVLNDEAKANKVMDEKLAEYGLRIVEMCSNQCGQVMYECQYCKMPRCALCSPYRDDEYCDGRTH